MVCVELCLVAGTAGSIITKYLGVSDTIFGLWIGFIMYIVYVILNSKIQRKEFLFLIIGYILATLIAAFKIYELVIIEKTVLGILLGIPISFVSSKFNTYLIERKIRVNRFQGVIINIIILVIATIFLHFLKV